jgi:hypothetical protein
MKFFRFIRYFLGAPLHRNRSFHAGRLCGFQDGCGHQPFLTRRRALSEGVLEKRRLIVVRFTLARLCFFRRLRIVVVRLVRQRLDQRFGIVRPTQLTASETG